jgi:formylglycine-generating enzyme required for sulfatase activity
MYEYTVATNRANRPVNYVSFFDAMRFTNWLENGQPTGPQGPGTTDAGVYTIVDGVSEARASDATYFLPSEDEWYKAAYHMNDGVTGHYWDYPTQSSSIPSNDLINPDSGNNANFYVFHGGYTIGSPYWTTEVSEFELSKSGYDTFDQGGNVWEWNEAVGYRGGSFYDGYGPYGGDSLHASYRYDYASPETERYGLGFRVASIPEPSTLLLGSISIVALLARRRRPSSPNNAR